MKDFVRQSRNQAIGMSRAKLAKDAKKENLMPNFATLAPLARGISESGSEAATSSPARRD